MDRKLRIILEEMRINRLDMIKSIRKDVELKMELLRRTIEKSDPKVTC